MSTRDNCHPDNECWPECSANLTDEHVQRIEQELRAEDFARTIDPGTRAPLVEGPASTPRPTAPERKVWRKPEMHSTIPEAALAAAGLAGLKVTPLDPPLTAVEQETMARLLDEANTPYAIPTQRQPSGNLPDGVKSVMWIPTVQGDGSVMFSCTVDGFGYRTSGSSRNKMKALAYALEELSAAMIRTVIAQEVDRG